MKRFTRFVFGWLAFLIGTAILIWCAYCLFVPNRYFQWRLIDVPRLALPLAMVWFGWNWIRPRARKELKYAAELRVTVKLSDSDFGTETERSSMLALKHKLEDRLRGAAWGEIDGEEFGGGQCSLFVQTNAPLEA